MCVCVGVFLSLSFFLSLFLFSSLLGFLVSSQSLHLWKVALRSAIAVESSLSVFASLEFDRRVGRAPSSLCSFLRTSSWRWKNASEDSLRGNCRSSSARSGRARGGT